MCELTGLNFIKYYEKHRHLFKYKLSDEFKKIHDDYEDPMADNCVGSDSEYYIGWNAFMIEEVPVFIMVINHEWVQELCVYMSKEAMLVHDRYEWLKLLEERGVFIKNLKYSTKNLMGLSKDIAVNNIGTAKTAYCDDRDSCAISFIVDFGFSVHFYDVSPYLLGKLFKMKLLNGYNSNGG